jgi:hypothetical protein
MLVFLDRLKRVGFHRSALTISIQMKKLFIVFFTLASLGCSSQVASDSNVFLSGKRLSSLADKKLEEASGLGASQVNPGMLWTHNDSGNPAEVFLIDQELNIKLTLKLKGVENRDWEDICVGPGPEEGKSYLYVGDIGDNFAQFQLKYIYRFPEPKVSEGTNEITIENFDTLIIQLPSEKKDTETLMINPITKDLYLVSKREEPVHVYEIKFPYKPNETITARDIGTIAATKIVAGDFSANGKEILLKNYQNVFYWNNTAGKSVEEVFKTKPEIVEYTEEPQGEAITWSRDGSGFYTLSEKKKGEKSYLYFYPRK